MTTKVQCTEGRPGNDNPRQVSDNIVYIDTPTYAPTSNGIKCIYYLAARLAGLGVNVRLLPRQIGAFRRNVPSQYTEIPVGMTWQLEAQATIICLESVPSKTIKIARKKGLRIFWWFLAPYGLLAMSSATPKVGEKLAVFSSYVYPEKDSYYLQPPLDSSWLHAIRKHRPPTDHKKITIAVYCGKGVLKALPEELRSLMVDADIRVITRSSPGSRSALFKLLSTLDGIITFDEISQLTLEAASVGLPVFIANPLFPVESSLLFPLPIDDYVTSDYNEFIVRIQDRRSNRMRPIPLSSLMSYNHGTITRILDDLESASWEWAGIALERRNNIVQYGRELRKKNIIAPYYGGQSAGTYLFRLYILSLVHARYIHLFVCMLISALDRTGKIFYLLGLAKVFSIIVVRFKKSRSLRAGSRLIGK